MSYVKVYKGKCTAEKVIGQSVIETCTFSSLIGPPVDTEPFYDLLDFSNLSGLEMAYFDDKAEHDRALSGQIDRPKAAATLTPRCVGMTADKLKRFLAQGERVIDEDYGNKYLSSVISAPQAATFKGMADGILAKFK